MSTLKFSSTWYAGSVDKATITEIHFVNSQSEVPSGWTEEWNADDGDTGSIKGYLNGTVVYIAGDGSGNVVANSRCSWMFGGCSSLTTLDLTSFDTSNVTNMYAMFANCSALTSVDLSNFNTSSATIMTRMFYGCSSLTTLDLTSFDTSNVTDMSIMFSSCSALTSVDLSNFNTSSATTMESMFSNCDSLTTLDLTSFDTSNVADMSGMFYSCNGLKSIYVSERWSTTSVTSSSNMFLLCMHLVGGNGTKWNSTIQDATYACVDNADTPGYFTYKRFYPFAIRGDFMIQGEMVYDLAEKIRVLNGTEEPMTPAEMDTNLTTANTEVGSQSDIIAQIISALGMNELTFVLEANSELPTEKYSSNTHVCSFVKGMTWAEWIGSEYNTDGYYLFEDGDISSSVRTPDGLTFGTYDVGTDLIEAKTYYVSLS